MSTATLQAQDIMQTELVTVRRGDSIREAMELMVDNHVTGLPVVDGRGRCVGVVSITDILGLEYEQAESASEFEEVGSYFDPDEQRWEHMRFWGAADELPDLTIGDVMSTDIISVPRDASVREVAKLMVENGVHRVLVVDEKRHLHGLIAAMDIVRVVAES